MEQPDSVSSDDSQQTRKEELRIVLVGKTGCGKSATGNTIFGKDVFTSHISPTSITKKCQNNKEHLYNRDVIVVDTPGLFDTKIPNAETSREIGRCILFSSPGPHAIIFVMQLGRFTQEEKDTINLIQRIFGDDVIKYIIFLFTRAEDLGETSLNVYLKETDADFCKLLEKCKDRACAFSNTAAARKKKDQVTNLITIINKMVHDNEDSHYTNEMYSKAEEKIKAETEKLKEKYRQEEENMRKEIERKKEEELKMREEKLKKQEEKAASQKEKEDIENKYKKILEDHKEIYTAKQENARCEAQNNNDILTWAWQCIKGMFSIIIGWF